MAHTAATPSQTLPKSNFHQALASASAGKPVSDALPPETSPHGDVDLELQVPTFSHPDHVIPPPTYAGVDTLIIVCCHAIFHPDVMDPSFPLKSTLDESNWYLAPFQKSDPKTGKPGEHETFLAHIAAGLDALTTGSCAGTSLLVFSGGATKSSLTPLSEARSYYHAALNQALAHGQFDGGRVEALLEMGRVLLEEQATDSFQNLLFSILHFRQTTGSYPKDIRIITHAFKTRRFLELHGPAIRWPATRIRVEGIDPIMSSIEYEETINGEQRFGYGPWKDDPLGTSELLSRKREQRGWQRSAAQHLVEGLEDSVRQLFDGTVTDSLPWIEQQEPQKEASIPTAQESEG